MHAMTCANPWHASCESLRASWPTENTTRLPRFLHSRTVRPVAHSDITIAGRRFAVPGHLSHSLPALLEPGCHPFPPWIPPSRMT